MGVLASPGAVRSVHHVNQCETTSAYSQTRVSGQTDLFALSNREEYAKLLVRALNSTTWHTYFENVVCDGRFVVHVQGRNMFHWTMNFLGFTLTSGTTNTWCSVQNYPVERVNMMPWRFRKGAIIGFVRLALTTLLPPLSGFFEQNLRMISHIFMVALGMRLHNSIKHFIQMLWGASEVFLRGTSGAATSGRNVTPWY